MAALFNVYRWHRGAGALSRPVRVWQGEAKHGPDAIAQAHAAKPTLRGQALFARCAHKDPYAKTPHPDRGGSRHDRNH